ncbi:NTF2 fold immunity protein [Pseudomonas plecoglossicida]|uniref:NTF2 fold immunity protein n=1 Tax=Pseudomonas plecoglossicida TaxID=70775 RepID=UPI003D1B34C2
MLTKDSKENAIEILMSFMREMNCWENEFFEKRQEALAKGVDDPKLRSEYSLKLESILDGCAVKDKSNYGRLIDLGCTKPATYDPDSDEVLGLEGSASEQVIQVQQLKGAETCSRFQLVFRDGRWKIKKKEIMDFNDKWRRSPL